MAGKPKTPPGIEARPRANGKWAYRVRFKHPITGERDGEEFDTIRDAADFKAKLRIARRSGMLEDMFTGEQLLREFMPIWWKDYARTHLAKKTRTVYAAMWNKHANPRIGHLPMRDVKPKVILQFRNDLKADGVGPAAIRKTLSLLQAAFREAIVWGQATSNPVVAVRKPSGKRKRIVYCPSPVRIERLRSLLDMRDALMVTLMGYVGLRPEELLALEDKYMDKNTILIAQKNINGVIVPGLKTGDAKYRNIDVFKPVRFDIAEYLLALSRPPGCTLLFPRPDGKPWLETDYRNWRRRVYRPAAIKAFAGLEDLNHGDGVAPIPRPYDLRHAFASLLLREDRRKTPVDYIARQLGHSEAVLHNTYAHQIAELSGHKAINAEREIAKARAKRPQKSKRPRNAPDADLADAA